MKNDLFKLSLILIGISTLSLTGCQTTKKQPIAIITPTPTEVIALDDDAATKDIAPFVDEGIVQTPLEEIKGEGIADDTLPNLAQINDFPIGTPVTFTDESGNDFFALTINSVETATDSSLTDIPNNHKAVIVDYVFANISSTEPLLFDDMSFKLIANNIVSTPLFFDGLIPADIAFTGETSSGQLAFLVNKDITNAILVFENASTNTKASFNSLTLLAD
jgi:Telomeric repeat-binding factor 2.